MSYIDTPAKCRRIQQALIDRGYDCGPDGADGELGTNSAKAILLFRADHHLDNPPDSPAVVDTDLMRELGLLAIQSPIPVAVAKARGIDLLTLIGLIGPISNLLKGKTMTTDQITGILRLVLGLIAGYFITKGIGDQSLWDWISAGVLTAIPAAWSWYSNRPKTILSIADKQALKQ